MNIQAKVALDKEKHPEHFCKVPRCLWKVVKLDPSPAQTYSPRPDCPPRQQLEAEWAKASGYATSPCPFCDGKDPEFFCEHCLGSRVVLSTNKVPLKRRWHLLAWGMVFFLIACGLLWIAIGQ